MKKPIYFVLLSMIVMASCGQQIIPVQDYSASNTSVSDTDRTQAVNMITHLRLSELEKIVEEASKSDNPDAFIVGKLSKMNKQVTSQEFGPLNAAETQVCKTNAYKCSQTVIIASGSETVAMNNFSDGQYDGRQDAFRHSYWNAVMTAEIDETWATQFANAHEQGEPYTISSQMDYQNNQVGRNIGRSYRVGQRSYIEAAIRTAVLGGRTVRVCNGALKPTGSSPSC